MTKLLSLFKGKLSSESDNILLLLFLCLLGSHFLDYHLYVFIAFALFLIKWRTIYTMNTLLVSFFILSVYITWVFLDFSIIYQFRLIQEVLFPGILILLMYFLGLGIKIKQEGILFISDKRMFYLFFIFVISYTFFILWSYLAIPQDNPLTGLGMYVCFPNPYQRANINGGHLISTILTYYLTLMTFILPIIIFYFQKLKKRGFYTIELLLLLGLSFFVLYISAIMGRRTVFVLFALVFLFLFFTYVVNYRNIKKVLFLLTLMAILFYGIKTYINQQENIPEVKAIIVTNNFIIPIVQYPKQSLKIEDSVIFNRLTHQGLKDKRFSWWQKSFSVMLDHPFGGGYDEYIAPGIKLTHNVWLDMGKDLGILPFILFLVVTLVHIYYLIQIFFSRQIENLLKYQLVIIAMGIFPIMLIEPIFNSDKTFFAYIFFYFGILARTHLYICKK